MKLRPLIYNILIGVSVATTGTLWLTRIGNSVQPQDIIDTLAGWTERCYATKKGEHNWIEETGDVWQVINIGNSAYSYLQTDPSNPSNLISTPFIEIGALKLGTYTNFSLDSDYDYPPPGTSGFLTVYNYTSMYVGGTWSNIVVSGFASPFDIFNEIYYFESRDGNTFTYTNSYYDALIYSPERTYLFSGWMALEKQLVPWLDSVPFIDLYEQEDPQYASIVMDGLQLDKIAKFPMFDRVLLQEQRVIGNGLGSYDTDMKPIDDGLFGRAYAGLTNAASEQIYAYHFNIWNPSVKISNGVVVVEGWSTHPFYIPEAHWGVGTFTNSYDLRFDKKTFYDTCGIPDNIANRVTIGATGGGGIWGIPDDLTPYAYFPYNFTGWKSTRHYNQIVKSMLTVRQKGMKQLKVNWLANNHIEWICPPGVASNYTSWYGAGSNYTEALANLAIDFQAKYDGYAPRVLSTIKYHPGSAGVFINMERVQSVMVNRIISSNVASKVNFYAYATNTLFNYYTRSYGITNLVFEAFGEDLELAKFKLYDDTQSSYISRTNATSTVILGDIDMMSYIPAEPAIEGVFAKGFDVSKQEIMANWDFKYSIE